MSDKRSPQESFALAEQCHSMNGDAKSVPDEEKDPAAYSPQHPSKKSCLKVNRSPDIRAVSFDATAVKERATGQVNHQLLRSMSWPLLTK